jgi:phytoene synthase
MHAAEAPPLDADDLAACRALLRGGSRSFSWAAKLLPEQVGAPATALYAFCRRADDLIDMATGSRAAALDALHGQLDRVYAGAPRQVPEERLLAAVVQRHRIPRALLDALLEGFAWDAGGRRYRSLSELHAYSARVAGSVGALMTLLMGVRTHAVLARACDLGVAMQLTNIARDVGEDARAGRVYLPLDWMGEAGIDVDDWLRAPVFTAALGAVIERVLAAADELYVRSAAGVAALPARCRPGIHAAQLLYAEIGADLRRNGLDSLSRRAYVSGTRKAQLVAVALWAATRPAEGHAVAPLPETRFLVEAVPEEAGPAVRPGRAEWVLELFERLQERDQPGGRDALEAR